MSAMQTQSMSFSTGKISRGMFSLLHNFLGKINYRLRYFMGMSGVSKDEIMCFDPIVKSSHKVTMFCIDSYIRPQ
jgi:hypothetical protein